jgi:two-component system nitrogen regulation sensor histidine kinase NtrY
LFESDLEVFREGFRALAQLRYFQAAYLINSANERLVIYETDVAPAYQAPTAEQLAEAAQLVVVQVDREAEALRALVRVEEYPDAYLYVIPDVNPEMFEALSEAEAAIATFNAASAEREQIERLFYLIYLTAALLILSGSVWLALSAAARVADPVGRLVEAADRVRRGDLSARVEVSAEDDEVTALGRAFNLMTGQISRQRQELIDANAESEGRRRLIEAVLLGVSAGVLSIDAEGRVRLANRSAEYLLGAEEGALLDRPLAEIAEGLADIAARARSRPGGTVQQEIELTRDGAALVFNVRAALDRDSDGERVVLTFDDITRLITAQRNAAWRDVARRIAHEIKNPLTPIQLSAERLRRRFRPADENDAEVFDRCTDTIIRQVSDIGRMVDEFSAFARMPTPHIERASLQELAQETVFARRVASPDIRVTLEAPAGPVIVHCDARLASQALANILKNAAESLTEQAADGRPPPGAQIDVRVQMRGEQGVVEVQDNGPGWPAGSRDRLTEPYMTTREKGTGLGLAIVQRIMEDHRGALELDVRADGEQGAVVRLAFPLADEAHAVEAAE